MAGSYNSQANQGDMLPTTYIWEINQINDSNLAPDLKLLLVRLYQNISDINKTVNRKDSGYYTPEEFLNSQLFFPNPSTENSATGQQVFRQVFRTTVDFGALPNTTTKIARHNIEINNGYSFTRIYGCATNSSVTSFVPLPYASAVPTDCIELNADEVNVNITTSSDWTDYTTCYVILEYIKQ